MQEVGQENDEALRFARFEFARGSSTTLLQRTLVVFTFWAAVLMTPAFAVELALHMLLESFGFFINLFLSRLFRPSLSISLLRLFLFQFLLLLERYRLYGWCVLQRCCSAEGGNDAVAGQDDAAQPLVLLPFRATVQEPDPNGAAGVMHVDNTRRRETADAGGVDQQRILIEYCRAREAAAGGNIHLRENVEVAAGRKIRR